MKNRKLTKYQDCIVPKNGMRANSTVLNAHTRDQDEVSPSCRLHLLCRALRRVFSSRDSLSRVLFRFTWYTPALPARWDSWTRLQHRGERLSPRRGASPCARRRCFLGGRGLRRVNREGVGAPILEKRTCTRAGPAAERNVSLVTSLLAASGSFAEQPAATKTARII